MNRRSWQTKSRFYYLLTLLHQADVPHAVTKSPSGAELTYRTSLRKFFFRYSRKNISDTSIKNFKSPALRDAGNLRHWILGKHWIFFFFFFPTVTHRIFKKLRRYFPDPLATRESFRKIAARRKRVNTNQAKYEIFLPKALTLTFFWMMFGTSCGAERVKNL